MAWLKTIGIFLKGLFGFLNNPKRLEIKQTKQEVRKPVAEADAVLDTLKKEDKIDKQEHKNADRAEKRDLKDAFGPAPRLKNKKAKKKANKQERESRKANR